VTVTSKLVLLVESKKNVVNRRGASNVAEDFIVPAAHIGVSSKLLKNYHNEHSIGGEQIKS